MLIPCTHSRKEKAGINPPPPPSPHTHTHKKKTNKNKKNKQKNKKTAIRVQEREKKQDRLKEIDNDLAMIKSGIEIAENSIKDGNSHLESLLTKGILDRDAIAKAHQKI